MKDIGIRFLKAFGLMLLFLAAWALVLLAVFGSLIAADVLEEDSFAFVGIVFGCIFLIAATMLPYLHLIGRWAFHFKSEGQPIPLEELKKSILSTNQFDVPVMVQERDGKLVATWKYVDAKWWEIFAKAGLKQIYELQMKFNPKKHEVTLIDIHKSVSWRAGPTEVKIRGGFFRGIMLEYAIGKQWGIKENFQLGKIYDYKFNPLEIKNPIMNEILKRGWDVRFGIW